ncbi:MAG: biotin transporter BioY [Acidobacteria bacterium]|nr:biotin transporter BioY [Acidobacteriota bacterium]
MSTYAKAETMVGATLAPLGWVKKVAVVAAFGVLLALSARVAAPLPFSPIPVTMQTFVVLLAGALLGSRLGAITLAAYVVEGAAGLPVFSLGRGGLAYVLLTPATGYILSYPLAAFATGWLAERGWDRRYLSAAAAMLVGSAVILLCGWLGFLRFAAPAPAFALGVAPFLPGDLLKVLLAAAVLPTGWALVGRRARRG